LKIGSNNIFASFLKNSVISCIYLQDFVLIRPDLYIAWCGNEIPTLLHNENVNEGAKVLMKVVTGAASLPSEWQRSWKNRHASRTWRFPLFFSLLVGATAGSVMLLRRFKWIQ
jgi:hypothetical protein